MRRPKAINIVLGTVLGSFTGVMLGCATAVIVLAQGGSPHGWPRLLVMFLTDMVGLGIVGALIGIFAHLITSRRRAMIAGMLGLFPYSFAVGIELWSVPRKWSGSSWFALVAGTFLLGMFGGYKFWLPVQRTAPQIRRFLARWVIRG